MLSVWEWKDLLDSGPDDAPALIDYLRDLFDRLEIRLREHGSIGRALGGILGEPFYGSSTLKGEWAGGYWLGGWWYVLEIVTSSEKPMDRVTVFGRLLYMLAGFQTLRWKRDGASAVSIAKIYDLPACLSLPRAQLLLK